MPGYGLKGKNPAVHATGAATLAASSDETYSWDSDNPVQRPCVQNNGAGNLWVKFNATSCSNTSYDFKLPAGDHVIGPSGLIYDKVTIYSDTELTYQTDFVVHGWV